MFAISFLSLQVGEGEDPLSEDTVIIECEARRRTVRRIKVLKKCVFFAKHVALKNEYAVLYNVSHVLTRKMILRHTQVSNVLAATPTAPPTTLSVKTDLGCLLGAATVRVGSSPVEYELSVQSAVGGTFFGSVTFTDEKTGEVLFGHHLDSSVHLYFPYSNVLTRSAALGLGFPFPSPASHTSQTRISSPETFNLSPLR